MKTKIYTNKGVINIKLLDEVAPVTVVNFINLSLQGFYNNIKFHRVISDFMIQGGDPTGTGMGGPGYRFNDEFKENVIFDKPGILAMANSGPNTNGSQFFITHVETPWLNYKHTIFGYVIDELDQEIVNSISQGDIIEKIEIIGDLDKFKEKYKEIFDEFEKLIKGE